MKQSMKFSSAMPRVEALHARMGYYAIRMAGDAVSKLGAARKSVESRHGKVVQAWKREAKSDL